MLSLLLIMTLTVPIAFEDQNDWRHWRGPLATGEAPGANPPVEWSASKNVHWKVDVPGLGHGTPIIADGRIYLTTAMPQPSGEAEKEEEETGGAAGLVRGGRGRGRGRGGAPAVPHEFMAMCLDLETGKEIWRKTLVTEKPHEGGHPTNSQASASPVIAGDKLYVPFGSRGLHCLSLDGEIVWSKDLGKMQTRNQFGEGSTPAVYGDWIVQNWDHEGDSFIVAFDRHTGEEKWRKSRDEVTSWATPLILPVGDQTQVIVPATNFTRAYELETGKEIWRCSGLTTNCIPSPIEWNGLVYVMSGYRGNMLQAIDPKGAEGDITETDHVVWTFDRHTPYVPSPLLYEGNLYFLSHFRGMISCHDAKTGAVHYGPERLEALAEVYASPIGAAGRVYIPGRAGTTVVLQAGKEFKILATNELPDEIDASPVAIGNKLLLRGHDALYCLAEK
ncbi:MAG: PQQ-binding-like beta-propeller repeat protein [Planctomycetota bacterium]